MADDFSASDKQHKQAQNQNAKQNLKMLYRDNPNFSHIIDTALQTAEAIMDPNLPKVGFSFRKLSSRYTRIDVVADRAFEEGDLELSRTKYNESLQLKHRALLLCSTTEDRSKILAEMATTINNLAYMKQRQRKRSCGSILSAYETVLLIKQYVNGPRHITVGTTLNNIGSVHFIEGNRLEAIIAYRKARKILREHFGLEHLDICVVSSNIGDVFYQLGQWKQASTEYRAALRLRWIIFGKKDPKVVRLMERLAETEMRSLNSESEAGESNVEMEDDCLSDDGSFVGAVDHLQCEIDQDLVFFDSLEQKAPVEMIRDKTTVFKELRQLHCESTREPTRIGDIYTEEDTASVATESEKGPQPKAEASPNDEISNSEAGQSNPAFDFSGSISSPWAPPESISREFDMLSACIMDMENLVASNNDDLEQHDASSASSCSDGSTTEHGRLLLSVLLSDDESEGSISMNDTRKTSLYSDSKADNDESAGLSDQDKANGSQSRDAHSTMDPIILLSALCSSSLVLQNKVSIVPTTESLDVHFDLEESNEVFKDSTPNSEAADKLPATPHGLPQDESTSLPEAISDQISLRPIEVRGSIMMKHQDKEISSVDNSHDSSPHPLSSYHTLILLSAFCSSARLIQNSAAPPVGLKFDETEEPPIVCPSNAEKGVASRITLEHTPSLSEASTASDSTSPQKSKTLGVDAKAPTKTGAMSSTNDDSMGFSISRDCVESNQIDESANDEDPTPEHDFALDREECTAEGLKPLSTYLNLTRSRKKPTTLRALDPDQRHEALVQLRERLVQLRQ